MNMQTLAEQFGGKSTNLSTTELKLEDVSYQWVRDTSSVPLLKRAVKLIEEDGNYFKELKSQLLTKIREIEGKPEISMKAAMEGSEQEKEKAVKELMEWEVLENASEEAQKKSEDQKNRGNDALRSGDLQEAIECYTKAIEFNQGESSLIKLKVN